MVCQLEVSTKDCEPEWDDFLAQTPGGHPAQTSMWARLKASLGWRAIRILARENDSIVGGAQVLVRRWARLGAIGHVPKGPLLQRTHATLLPRIVSELHKLAKTHQIRYLQIQAPDNGAETAEFLLDQGFMTSVAKSMPTATILIDLMQDPDAILGQMRKKTRYGIRRSKRDGVTVREGTKNDLHTFHELLVATGRRQGFTPFAEDYFEAMWRIFHPAGCLALLISEFEGKPTSAQLIMTFAGKAAAKQFGWSGQFGEHRPNEALEWATILWAREQGCRYYDLEGIELTVAHKVAAGEPIPDTYVQSATSYKLGFGGQVAFLPEPCEYIYNPVIRKVYSTAFPRIAGSTLVKKAMNEFRTQ